MKNEITQIDLYQNSSNKSQIRFYDFETVEAIFRWKYHYELFQPKNFIRILSKDCIIDEITTSFRIINKVRSRFHNKCNFLPLAESNVWYQLCLLNSNIDFADLQSVLLHYIHSTTSSEIILCKNNYFSRISAVKEWKNNDTASVDKQRVTHKQ